MLESTLNELVSSKKINQIDDLYQYFDSLEPVEAQFMIGRWTGDVILSGHVGEKMLGSMSWAGKNFVSADEVYPILVKAPDGSISASDVLGQASLREVLYRGKLTATMVYDSQPTFDYFRKINSDTVMGIMDHKGDLKPLFFYLVRNPDN